MTNEVTPPKLDIGDRTKDFLGNYGWFEGRRVSFEISAHEIRKRGFKWNSVAETILRELDGVAFQSINGGIPWFEFGHRQCFHTFRSDHVPILETLAEELAPCPIGGGGGYLLFVFPSGRFALLHEQWFFLAFSESLRGMLDAMIYNNLEGCRVVENVEAYQPDW